MRRDPILIRLGPREWRVRPLTLKQVQEIEPLLFSAGDAAGTAITMAVKIIAVALARDHADSLPTLDAIEATAQEIGIAMAAVLQLGGFVPTESRVQGEVPAGADWTSAPSTPA